MLDRRALKHAACDCYCNDLNGRELSATVREQTAGMPVIFITGFAGEQTLNGESVLRKPFKTSVLTDLIGQQLR